MDNSYSTIQAGIQDNTYPPSWKQKAEELAHQTGGFTIHDDPNLPGDAPVTGYQVAIPGHEDFTRSTGQGWADWARENQDIVRGPDRYMGTWRGDDERFYTEPSQRIEDYDAAARAAVERDQWSMWGNDAFRIDPATGEKIWHTHTGPQGHPVPTADIPRSDIINQGLAGATGFTLAKRRDHGQQGQGNEGVADRYATSDPTREDAWRRAQVVQDDGCGSSSAARRLNAREIIALAHSTIEAARAFTPQEHEHYKSRGWRGTPCEDPTHHGLIGQRCAECGKIAMPDEVELKRVAIRCARKAIEEAKGAVPMIGPIAEQNMPSAELPWKKEAGDQADLEWQRSYSDSSWQLTTKTPEGISKTVVTEPRIQALGKKHLAARILHEAQEHTWDEGPWHSAVYDEMLDEEEEEDARWHRKHAMDEKPDPIEEAAAELGKDYPDEYKPWIADALRQYIQEIQESHTMPEKTGWYHASNQDLPVGTRLVPGGGKRATSDQFYDEMGYGQDTGTLMNMGGGREEHVWLTPWEDDAHFWAAANNSPHIYEVEPESDPLPWNGTGVDGYVTPSAVIKRKVSGPEMHQAAMTDEERQESLNRLLKEFSEERTRRYVPTSKMYRGLQMDLPPELEAMIKKYRYPAMKPEEVGQILNIGPALLDHIQKSHPNAADPRFPGDEGLGIGRHWTTDKHFAEVAAMQGGPGGHGRHRILLEADNPGEEYFDRDRTAVGGVDSEKRARDEEEFTFLPGSPINVTSVNLNGDEVLHDSHYEKAMPEYGNKYIGGPRQVTAAATGDCFAVSGRYMLDNDDDNLKLVHGQANQGGKLFSHAWVEDGDNVIDKAGGQDIRMPKEQYYQQAGVEPLYRYDREQALVNMLRHKHWGPWDYTGETMTNPIHEASKAIQGAENLFGITWPMQVLKYLDEEKDPRIAPENYPRTYKGERPEKGEGHSPTYWDGSRIWDMQELVKRHRPEMEKELVNWYQGLPKEEREARRAIRTARKVIANEEFNSYLQQARRNLMATSRTAQGVVDTSASPDKAQHMMDVSGQQAANLAGQNFDNAIRMGFENRDRQFQSPADVRQFVESMAGTINNGILQPDRLYRTHDSPKYPYTPASELPRVSDDFYSRLHQGLNDPQVDPVKLAAYAEWGTDPGYHLFADGCGKTAKALSSYILMRHRLPLPTYAGGRDEYYANVGRTHPAGMDEARDNEAFGKFLNYYRRMVPRGET